MFVPDSSYQLSDTVENDVYTFTVTVTNAAGSSREISERVVGKLFISFIVMKTSIYDTRLACTCTVYSYPVNR